MKGTSISWYSHNSKLTKAALYSDGTTRTSAYNSDRNVLCNTNISKGLAHLSRLTPVTKVTNMNGSSDVSGVNEGYVVTIIRRRLQKIK